MTAAPSGAGISGAEWRVLDGVATAWFGAASLTVGAEFAARLTELSIDVLIDLRASGARVRLETAEHVAAVSAAAHDLGLVADPAVLQGLSIVLESPAPTAVEPFWQRVLGYVAGDDGGLVDPLRRDPELRIRQSTEPRPLRHRVHLDVVRPAAAVEQADVGEPFGPYGVCHADADGNEVDFVPAEALGDGDATADWQAVFGAVACYRTASRAQQRDLAVAAASLADDVGFPLLVDLRPGLVVLDSGKDLWDADAHGLDLDFGDLAARIQAVARELGATAEPGAARFVQFFLDAADVDAVRAFWIAALGYVPDRRAGLTDIHDPRRLDPVVLFQPLDASDTERRTQRNRIHAELTVPADIVETRVASMLAVGGRVLAQSPGRVVVADPEGNELAAVYGT